ncbi:MAG: CPBP family intramembrane metalloprotease [Bacteroidales bacterium]|nr:CPBP family intramembrane metalloprotease [Bacteroidales bacterium]
MSFVSNAFIGQNTFVRYLGGVLIVIFASQVIGAIPLAVAMAVKIYSGGGELNLENPADLTGLGINQNLNLVLLLIPFIVGLFGVWLAVKLLNGRTLKQTITGRSEFAWKRFFSAAGIWLVLLILMGIINYALDPDNFEWNFQPDKFFVLILIALFLLPLQTTFEEVFFRGYLMQGILVGFRNRGVALISTTLIFGLLHLFNPEVKEFGVALALPQYLILGLILGIATLMDDGLELALGLHAMNNVFLAIFITFDASALQTPALFSIKEIDPLVDLIELFIASLLFIFWASRRYKWSNWKEKLMGVVSNEEISGKAIIDQVK